MSYHPPPEEPPAPALSRGQWALAWVAGGLATIALALLVSREGPVAPVTLAAPGAPRPTVAVATAQTPAPRAATAAPAETEAQAIARAMAVLSAPGTATGRYCAASAVLVTIGGTGDKVLRDPPLDRAWHALEAAGRAALREQRAAFESGRGLICDDGQRSPTCVCHGPHGGCCSHHGGVRGCEPLPDRVTCPPSAGR